MVRFHLAPLPEPAVAASGDARSRTVGECRVVKKLIIIAGLLGAAVYVAKKVKDANDERALWHEATTAPDLR